MRIEIVDVFAERPLAGNQLAVVHDAGRLTGETMQDIAREMNLSETTFVVSRDAARARVRIFTTSAELPFAGHPTIGTAWVLGRDRPTFTLDLDAGPVPVSFEDGVCYMTPPPVKLGETFDPGTAAKLIGLADGALDPGYPVQLAEVGPKFVLIGVKDRAALAAARLNADLHREYQQADARVVGLFVFTDDAHHADAQFAARMFFDSGGPREDPATGSANSAFAAYLHALRGGSFGAIVDQGVEMLRPSRLYLEVGEVIRVGGRVMPVIDGELTLPTAGAGAGAHGISSA